MTRNFNFSNLEAVPFSAIFSLDRGLNITKADLAEKGVPCLSYGQIHSKYLRFINQDIDPLPFVGEQNLSGNSSSLLNEGDFAFADTSEDYKGAGNFTCIRGKNLLFAGYHTTIARPNKRKIHSPYVAYFFDSHLFRKQVQLKVCGIKVFSVTNSILNGTKVLLPTIAIQKKIASHLDQKCSAIDQLIAKKKQLIEKLEEYRQSLVIQTVSTGLNSGTRIRKLDFDLISAIPQHWEIRKLKYLCSISTGNQDTQDSVENGKYPFYVRSPVVERTNRTTFSGEGILMAGDGVGAGKVFHHAFGQYGIHQRVYLLHTFSHLVQTKYFFYYLQSIFSLQVEKGTAKSTVPSIRLPMLKDFIVCLPPIEEQTNIAIYLDQKCLILEKKIRTANNAIEKLREYRSSLISAVVTGQSPISEKL